MSRYLSLLLRDFRVRLCRRFICSQGIPNFIAVCDPPGRLERVGSHLEPLALLASNPAPGGLVVARFETALNVVTLSLASRDRLRAILRSVGAYATFARGRSLSAFP